MTLTGVKVDDIVECDVKGRRFLARVTGRDAGGLDVCPLEHNVTWHRVTAHQVVEHWRKRRPRRAAA